MLEFLASDWNQVVRSLDRLSSLLNIDMAVAVMHGDREALIEPLQQVADHCAVLGLVFSASYATEIIQTIKNKPAMMEALNLKLDRKSEIESLAPADIVKEVSILKKRIDDELQNRKFLAVSPAKSAFYHSQYLFGEQVFENFPAARFDVEEAGTCYACSRSTASVFHLMRTMEVGLRTLGASLNNPDLDPRRNPSWERILKPCDEELRKPIAQRSTEWRQDELFFSNATANLRAVKDAWRNPTLHVEINYDEERALEILNAVKSFMRHLAEKLHE